MLGGNHATLKTAIENLVSRPSYQGGAIPI
jgi:hypothetical protein